jgi:hypothetical protein
MDEIRKLANSIREAGKKHVLVQTAWVIVKSVDWSKKTMVATGVVDDLDYHDVLLGIGSIYIKPKKGCKCLIGLIENKDGAAFLIDCEETEEVVIKHKKVSYDADSIIFNGGQNGGLCKKDKVAEKLNKIENDLNALRQIILGWTPTPSDGGLGLKTALTLAWTSQPLQITQASQLENTSIKH